MIRRPPRSTLSSSSAASDVYKRQDTNARPEEKEDFDADISDIRVLLVEDNELNVEIAEFMLTENGAKVETVNNGLEAVQHFEASEPGTYDVILMDVMMPVMDGLTAARTIRDLERQDAKTCLLYTSDAADEEDSGDLGCGRTIKKKKKKRHQYN